MKGLLIGGLAALLLSAGSAFAATENFTATLKGADETPPTTSAGTGALTASLDTKSNVFKYSVTYSGLTGPAVAAHFHGPAPVGKAAGPVVPVPKDQMGANPMTGQATLTAAQEKDLEGGLWYFNIHTAANPGGEVRGQVTKQ
ncbi:MAG TPA: CHRD domain-containing protein [Caulobacteraceae bacterium]|jgi:hypothetical protein